MLHLAAFVGGTPVLAVLNPLFWVMTLVWFVAHPEFIKQIFPAPVYYIGLISWAFGNFLLVVPDRADGAPAPRARAWCWPPCSCPSTG